MWTRAELKDRAKMCLSRYYWAAFLVSLIFAIPVSYTHLTLPTNSRV